MSATSVPTPEPSQRMAGLLMGHFEAECIHAVAVLGVADLLANGHTTIEALSVAANCDESSLHRVLRTLVRTGLFSEDARGRFELTALGATSRSPVNRSLSHVSRARGARRPSAFGRQDRPARAAWAALRLLADVANFSLAESGSGRTMELGRSGQTPARRRWCGRAQRGSPTGSSTTDRQIRRTSSLSPACVRSGISGWRVGALYPMAGGRRSAERRGEFSNNRKQGDC
jgi:predicted transcriptional regulator